MQSSEELARSDTRLRHLSARPCTLRASGTLAQEQQERSEGPTVTLAVSLGSWELVGHQRGSQHHRISYTGKTSGIIMSSL